MCFFYFSSAVSFFLIRSQASTKIDWYSSYRWMVFRCLWWLLGSTAWRGSAPIFDYAKLNQTKPIHLRLTNAHINDIRLTSYVHRCGPRCDVVYMCTPFNIIFFSFLFFSLLFGLFFFFLSLCPIFIFSACYLIFILYDFPIPK